MPRSSNPVPQYFTAKNKILVGGLMFYFEVGTSDPKATFSDQAETIQNTHPVVLDSEGRLPNVFFTGAAKQVLEDSDNVQIWERDNVGDKDTPNFNDADLQFFSTTQNMIDTFNKAVVLNDIVETLGFITEGDGGGAQWRFTGLTGQTVSQSPAQLGDALLNDANGNQWVLVIGKGVDFAPLGGDPLGVLPANLVFLSAANHAAANNSYVTWAGDFLIESTTGVELPAGNVVILCPEREKSRLIFDNVNSNVLPCLHSSNAITRLVMRGFSIVGQFGISGGFTEKKDMINCSNVAELDVEGCAFSGSFSGTMVIQGTSRARVTKNRFSNSYRDACRIMNAGNVEVYGNKFENILDDSIAISTFDTSPVSDNEINIHHNMLVDSQGIIALGGKTINIDSNIIKRAMHRGIRIGQGESFETGNTAILSATITNNHIVDIFSGTVFSASSGGSIHGIEVWMETLKAKDTVETGNPVVKPYPYLYTLDTDEAGIVNAGALGITISGNHVIRTLDATTNYSDYGFGTRLSRDGFVDPQITLADMLAEQIYAYTSGNGLTISGNNLHGGKSAINISPTKSTNGVAFRNYKVINNQIINYSGHGCLLTGDGLVEIKGNTFDADPYHEHTQRSANGSWGASFTQSTGVNISSGTELFGIIESNTFKNVGIPVQSAGGNGAWQGSENTQICDPSVTGYNASNIGIGFVHAPGLMGKMVIEDGNPSSGTFKTVLNVCAVSSPVIPTAGKYIGGLFVTDTSASLNYGWKRITNGSAHVLGVDWQLIN